MSVLVAALLVVVLLAPALARGDDPQPPTLAQPGSGLSLPPPPAPPAPISVDAERRGLEMDRFLRDAQRDQRQRAEERILEERGDRRALEEYRIRERREADARALHEDLDRRALGSEAGAAREAERLLEQQEFENRTGTVDDRMRARERDQPKLPGTKP